MIEEIHFKNKEAFRKWLEKNHDKFDGIWMIYYKKHTKKPSIDYSDALDEALCFGWIDSIIKRIDEDRYVRKFTPRKNVKNWSEVNKIKVMRLIQQKRMTIHGLEKIESYKKTGEIKFEPTEEEIDYSDIINIPEFIIKAFNENDLVWKNFKDLAPSYRKEYIRWIINAKREETRLSRINKTIERLLINTKPGML